MEELEGCLVAGLLWQVVATGVDVLMDHIVALSAQQAQISLEGSICDKYDETQHRT